MKKLKAKNPRRLADILRYAQQTFARVYGQIHIEADTEYTAASTGGDEPVSVEKLLTRPKPLGTEEDALAEADARMRRNALQPHRPDTWPMQEGEVDSQPDNAAWNEADQNRIMPKSPDFQALPKHIDRPDFNPL